MILVSIVVIASCALAFKQDASLNSAGLQSDHCFQKSIIPDTIFPDDGWHSFYFTSSSNLASPQFVTCLNSPAVFRITDAFCPGDQFSIYVNGVLMGGTDEVPAASNCTEAMIIKPESAFFSTHFSHGEFRIGPGLLGVNIVPSKSPFGQGIAYARIDLLSEKSKMMGFVEGVSRCRKMGLNISNGFNSWSGADGNDCFIKHEGKLIATNCESQQQVYCE